MSSHWAGIVIFLVSYAVFAYGRVPGTKMDRPAMAVIGATAMIAFRVFSPAEAVSAVDFTTLVLLFAMMVIVASLHLAGFFEWLTSHIVCRFPVGYLLPGVIFVSGLLSAFLVNDVVCVFMTPLLLRIAKEVRRPALPYLLALATASNIGSTATITGNPQNMLIGSVSHIGYSDFLLHLGPVAVVGLLIDWGLLRLLCTKDLNAVTETTYQQSSYMAKPIPHPLGADVGGGSAGPYREICTCYGTGANRFPRRLAPGVGRGDWRCCVTHQPQYRPEATVRRSGLGTLAVLREPVCDSCWC